VLFQLDYSKWAGSVGYFHPDPWGNDFNLTNIFRWVETNNYVDKNGCFTISIYSKRSVSRLQGSFYLITLEEGTFI